MASQATKLADGLWTAVRVLPPESRERFIERMIADPAFRQELDDILNLAIARERAHEPARSLDDVLAEIEAQLVGIRGCRCSLGRA